MSVCKDSNVKVSYGTRKNFFDVPVNSVHRFWPEGLVGECIIGIDADCFSVEIDKYTVESACTDIHYKDAPWVTRTSRPFEITRGLEGRHIALWQSHGKYYINNKDKWGCHRYLQ